MIVIFLGGRRQRYNVGSVPSGTSGAVMGGFLHNNSVICTFLFYSILNLYQSSQQEKEDGKKILI